MEQETKRTLHQIAKEICEDHDQRGKLLHYTLVPYVDAGHIFIFQTGLTDLYETISL